jgi:hypothetical protein
MSVRYWQVTRPRVATTAAALLDDCRRVRHPATAGHRQIRRNYTSLIRDWRPADVMQLARLLCRQDDRRWIGYELLANHVASPSRNSSRRTASSSRRACPARSGTR